MRQKIYKYFAIGIVTLGSLTLGGCYSSTNSVLDTKASQVQVRSYQSRAFDTNDKNQTIRSVVATLQDLDFVISKADEAVGTVTATKFSRNIPLQMTVTVRPRNSNQMVVRANAQYGINPVENPIAYQDFFSSLSKAMFLDAHEIT